MYINISYNLQKTLKNHTALYVVELHSHILTIMVMTKILLNLPAVY